MIINIFINTDVKLSYLHLLVFLFHLSILCNQRKKRTVIFHLDKFNLKCRYEDISFKLYLIVQINEYLNFLLNNMWIT